MICLNREKLLNMINKRIGYYDRLYPPNIITNSKKPDPNIEKALANKKFKDIDDNEKRILFGDLDLFNPQSFKYYYIYFIHYAITTKNIPELFDIFLLSLRYKDDKYIRVLDCEDIEIIYNFFQCVYDYMQNSNTIDSKLLKEDYFEEIKQGCMFWERQRHRCQSSKKWKCSNFRDTAE